ncbi:MAG: cytochrome C oxidase subunit IV family protein [Polyangiales bacterium]
MAHSHSHADSAEHVASVRSYVLVFAALVALTLLTVAVYQVHLGAMNLVVAILIATIKATLVVMIFMHMQHETRFNVLIFLGSLLFGGIFLAYTINDTEHRAKVDAYNGALVDPDTGSAAPALAEARQAELNPPESMQAAESDTAGASKDQAAKSDPSPAAATASADDAASTTNAAGDAASTTNAAAAAGASERDAAGADDATGGTPAPAIAPASAPTKPAIGTTP